MKQRISILIVAFVLFAIPAWAIYQSSTFGNRSGVAAVGGGGCSTVIEQSIPAGSVVTFATTTSDYGVGFNEQIASAKTVCGFSIFMSCNGGDNACGGRSFTGYMYSTGDTTALGSLLATSSSVSSLPGTTPEEVKFTFQTPYSASSSTDYIYLVLPSSADATNLARIQFDGGDTAATRYRQYSNVPAYVGYKYNTVRGYVLYE